MADLYKLLGYHVRVTNPDSKSFWEGWIVSLSDQPSLTLELDSGRQVTLPQAFTVAATSDGLPRTGADFPRPEHVVKAEFARQLADEWNTGAVIPVHTPTWLHAKADEIDPAAPECGYFLKMLADVGEMSKFGTCVSARGHEGEHLYRVTSQRFGEPS